MENKSTAVREEIINTSIGLFTKYGIRSVTMDDIAKELGISKKTIYQHFTDKDEIISIATQRYVQEECGKMIDICRTAGNAVEHLHLISEGLKETFKNMNPAVLYDLKKYHKKAWNIFLDYKENKIYSAMEENLRNGVRDGFFRKEINIKILTILRLAEIEMTFDKESFPHDEFSLVDIHTQLLDHFAYGILTDKGLKLLETYKNQLIHEK